jgi:hypothetical protein
MPLVALGLLPSKKKRSRIAEGFNCYKVPHLNYFTMSLLLTTVLARRYKK